MKPRITIPTITVRPPWSSWIAAGLKTIETRTHARFRSLEGRSIAIHSGKSFDTEARGIAAANVTPPVARLLSSMNYDSDRGKVVCLAHVAQAKYLSGSMDERFAALCDTLNLFGLFLDRVEYLPPTVARGRQGVWTWTPPATDYHDDATINRVRNHIEQTERNRR